MLVNIVNIIIVSHQITFYGIVLAYLLFRVLIYVLNLFTLQMLELINIITILVSLTVIMAHQSYYCHFTA